MEEVSFWIFDSFLAHIFFVLKFLVLFRRSFFVIVWYLDVGKADSKAPEWKKLNSKDLGIRTSSMIASPVKYVLNGLKKKGIYLFKSMISQQPNGKLNSHL